MPNTILIIDDSPDGTLLTRTALSKLGLGLRTESVSSGKNALEFLKTAPELPAMILLDLKMPGMDGIETLKRIRSDEQLNRIPIVITSISTLDEDVLEAREAGANGFVYKAIRLDEFSKDLGHYVKSFIAAGHG